MGAEEQQPMPQNQDPKNLFDNDFGGQQPQGMLPQPVQQSMNLPYNQSAQPQNNPLVPGLGLQETNVMASQGQPQPPKKVDQFANKFFI